MLGTVAGKIKLRAATVVERAASVDYDGIRIDDDLTNFRGQCEKVTIETKKLNQERIFDG